VKPPSILFLNRVYPPGDGATGQLLADLAPELVGCGHHVTVLTSGSMFSAPRSELATEVRVERVSGLAFTRASHWRRALSYLSLYPALLWRALRLPRADVVVTMTDPPMLAVLGAVIQRLKGSRHIHWAQDLYPELAEELAVLPKRGFIARVLRFLSSAALRRAEAVVAVGRCMKARIEERGIPSGRIERISNWGHAGNAACGARSAESGERGLSGATFRREHGLTDRFVIMYSGNLGLAHPFEAMLHAAEQLRTVCPKALFLFVGGGPRLAWVREQVVARGLDNVCFLPHQPRERLSESLAAADLHLASMLPELCGLVVPSKVYGVLAAGRPCVFLGPKESEVAQVIFQNACGSVLETATGASLATCFMDWVAQPAELEQAGQRARMAAEQSTLSAATTAFTRLIHRVCGVNQSEFSRSETSPTARHRQPAEEPPLVTS
jgi:colanic acid biosynthesis glycosyl transferase WcaI